MKKPIEKQLSSDEPKKGKKSWKPAQRMKVTGKNPDYEYRWIDATDPDNLRRKQEDGWIPVSELHGHTAENGEKQLTSVTETRGSVLHAIPKEDYQSHREYFQNKTKKQTAGLKRALVDEAEKSRPGASRSIHGTIVIE